LGLKADHAKTFTSIVSLMPDVFQKSSLEMGLGFGLKMSANFAPLSGLKNFLEADPKNSIRLLYPNIDFNY
jgi:hypothetical protein